MPQITKLKKSENVYLTAQVLGGFAKLRRETGVFFIPVRPSARVEQLGSHWTDFHEILYLQFNFCIKMS
jgi:hypothetical protein